MAREFWINIAAETVYNSRAEAISPDPEYYDGSDILHVIEKSAYDEFALKLEICLTREAGSVLLTNEYYFKSRAKLAIAVEALETLSSFKSNTDIMFVTDEMRLFAKDALDKINANCAKASDSK